MNAYVNIFHPHLTSESLNNCTTGKKLFFFSTKCPQKKIREGLSPRGVGEFKRWQKTEKSRTTHWETWQKTVQIGKTQKIVSENWILNQIGLGKKLSLGNLRQTHQAQFLKTKSIFNDWEKSFFGKDEILFKVCHSHIPVSTPD